ncbi:hypothetical protein ASG17_01835 [Brevundimonas sp. Leaf363]|uniref:hypothetical protein n=1 Tax=Brevundimonas sp. Leaf363 TaxID=1736353 RepID=UPI0006F91E27|nr:hypothetical protein [Brevundimonas sp. Leaf363]KQS57483.1 hypothetical protein ASG17_01835 [Brevundimonas sp. Leaf363]
MSLVEIARFDDVYRADLAAAFLADHGIDVDVTERFQTTVEPYMQRALGIRLLAPAHLAEAARDLLARAEAGEFAAPDDDAPDGPDMRTRAVATGMAVFLWSAGTFWGPNLPRRFRTVHWIGAGLIGVAAVTSAWIWIRF